MRLSASLFLLLALALAASPNSQAQIDAATDAVQTRPAPPPPEPVAVRMPASVQTSSSGLVSFTTPPDFEGVIEDNDPLQNGKPYDAYPIRVDRSTELTVTMISDNFDTFLIVRAPSGQEWTNDDFDGTRVSQVSFIAAEAGEYMVWATTYRDSGRGAYELHVSSKRATIVSETSGRLDYQDDQLIKGEFVDRLTVRAPDRGEFFLELSPLGFNGFVRVTTPGGVSTRGQSDGRERGSIRLGPLRGERGTWSVDVTTLMPGEVGAYDVRVITLDEQ